jgi:hypothetical protein
MRYSKFSISLVVLAVTVTFTSTSFAHKGSLDRNGGHNCSYEAYIKRQCDGYHYHGGFFLGEDIPKKEPTPSTEVEEVIPEGHVKVTLPKNKILISYKTGASETVNSTLKYPFFMYKDIIYAPLNSAMSSSLTIESVWSNEKGLSLKKTDKSIGELHFERDKISTHPANMYAQPPSFNIYVNDVWVDNGNEEYPFLVYKNVTYFPMTWHINNEFGLTIKLEKDEYYISR